MHAALDWEGMFLTDLQTQPPQSPKTPTPINPQTPKPNAQKMEMHHILTNIEKQYMALELKLVFCNKITITQRTKVVQTNP